MGIATAVADVRRDPTEQSSPRRRPDWFELVVLSVFACLSVWVLALDLYQAVAHHLDWTGTDGLFLGDQMQYLAWIQDSSRHLLVSDLFVIRGTPHDYFQPVIVISALITRLGVPAWLSLLLWKPVGVVAVFFAVRAFCRRILGDRFDRRAALVLALLFGSFGVVGDEWIPFWSWGYPFGLLAVAAVVAALIAYDRARTAGRLSWVAPVLGAVASFAHPWQGELLILIVIGTELATWRRGEKIKRLALPALVVFASALPLLYYESLYRFDTVWRLAQTASRHSFSLSAVVLPLLPLLICSIPAYLRRPQGFIETATRVWPLAALVIYGVSSSGVSGTPLHAFTGITIPLAVLAVEGVQRIGFRRLPGWRLAGCVLVALATVPATIHELRVVHFYITPALGNANFITHGEQRALDYLRTDPQPGGVLTRGYLGLIVPGQTGRRTYAGDCLWSEPNCPARQGDTWNLFENKFTPAAAQSFVRSTGARFLLEDCASTADLARTIRPLIRSVKRFGCATVYEVS